MVQNSNLKRVMVSGNHFKNGVSLKSRMSRGSYGILTIKFVLSLIMVFFSVACEKDKIKLPEEEPFNFNATTAIITAQVVEGNKYNSIVSTVKALSEMTVTSTMSGMNSVRAMPDGEVIASANWSNGGFILTLPTTINEGSLRDFISADFWGHTLSWFIYQYSRSGEGDRPKAFLIDAIAAYDASGNRYNDLILFSPEPLGAIDPKFLYMDRDVTIYENNEGQQGRQVLKFKKGWNPIGFSLGFKKGDSNPGLSYSEVIDDGWWWAFENILEDYGIYY